MNDFSLIPFEEGLTEQKKAVSIGFFDGVHRGHRFVFDRLREEAQRHGAAPWAVTFDVHPLAVLAPGQQPPLLTTLDEKIAALRRCGLAGAIVLHFDRKMAGLTAEQFMRELLLQAFDVDCLLVGYDHRFGRPHRAMDSNDIKKSAIPSASPSNNALPCRTRPFRLRTSGRCSKQAMCSKPVPDSDDPTL